MAKPKYGYGWLIKWIVAAILLAVGIIMAVTPQIVYVITGIVITIFSLFRVYPLLKTLKKEVLRTINLIEIIIGVVIGGVMVYAGFTQVGTDASAADTWEKLYRWFLAFFFYLRGVVFFVSVTYFEEKSEVPKFIFHIIALTLGAVIAMWEGFSAETLGWLFLFVSVASGAYLGFDGYGGYKKYRNYQRSLNKSAAKEEPKVKYDKDEPSKDVEIEKDVPNQPSKEEEKQEEIYPS